MVSKELKKLVSLCKTVQISLTSLKKIALINMYLLGIVLIGTIVLVIRL